MDSNPIVGYEKVKVTEIPLSAFDRDYENSDDGGSANSAAGLSFGDNGFVSDNNYGNRDRELILATLTARQQAVTQQTMLCMAKFLYLTYCCTGIVHSASVRTDCVPC
jgi:hypothetical protein